MNSVFRFMKIDAVWIFFMGFEAGGYGSSAVLVSDSDTHGEALFAVLHSWTLE